MPEPTTQLPPSLYLEDETAWLDQTAELLRSGRFDQVDSQTLAEYLTDMAKRDRREVLSRLVVLLIHLLKWDYQRDRRSKSWLLTILEQQRELRFDMDSGSLRNHALEVLARAYKDARKDAATETGLPPESFPESCPWDLDSALARKDWEV